MATEWLLCTYRLPREPSRLRLAIWRRLRRVGAVLLHDAVWVLPADAKTREDFEWLAEEIEERGGTALIWEARSIARSQDEVVVSQFRREAEARYVAVAETAQRLGRLAARRRLSAKARDQALQQLRNLDRALRLERRRGYFRAPGRDAAESAVHTAVESLRAAKKTGLSGGRSRALGN